jgi:Helix-hairpin-helix motif
VLSLPRFVFVALAILLARESAFNANRKPPLRPVNLNTVTVQELQQVPGIAPATADQILKMGKYLTVGRAAPPKKAVDATAPGSIPPDPAKPPPQAPPRTVNQESARSALRIALQKSNRLEGRPPQFLIVNPENSSIGGFMKIRFHVRGPDEFLLGVRCGEELGRRYGCRSLRVRRLF